MSDARGVGRTIYMPADIRHKLNVASAAAGLSGHEYILAAISAALMSHAEHDVGLAMVFSGLDKLAS